jgi:hypothetical protein
VPLPVPVLTDNRPRGLTGSDLVMECRKLYNQAKQARRNRLTTWTRNWQLVHNRFGALVAEPWMPNPRASEIYPIGSTYVAWLSDQDPNVTFAAAADPNSQEIYEYLQRLASDLSTVYESIWSTLNFDYQLKLGFWDDFIYGVGIYKSTWDQGIDFGIGNISLSRIHPWSIYMDPKATCFDDADYIIEARRMSLDEVERRYPGHGVVLDARSSLGEIDNPPTTESSSGPTQPLSNIIPPYGGNMTGITSSQRSRQGRGSIGDMVVYEFWLKENDEWWEDEIKHASARWRVVVICQGEILLDEYAEALWSHKSHPYSRFVSDDVGEFYGIALVDHLAYPQIYINRLLTAYQLNTELVGNPVLLEPDNSTTARANITNKPGQRIPTKASGGQNSQPSWLTPPAISGDVLGLINWWKESMATVSGLDAMKPSHPRTAQGTTSATQEPTFVRVRAILSNLEMTVRDIAMKHADLIIDNYDEPRMVAVTGKSGEQTSMALSARHFNTNDTPSLPPLKYAVKVDAGSELPTSLAGRIAREVQLFGLGITDDLAVLQAMRYPHAREVLERKYQKQMEGKLAGKPGGGAAPRQARAGNSPPRYNQGPASG